MLFEEANRLIEPGYTALETGCFALPNGQMHVAVHTRLPGRRAKMVDRWFRHLDTTEQYRVWEPGSHIRLVWDASRRPGVLAGSGAAVWLNLGRGIMALRIHFHQPREFLKTSVVENADELAAVCANVYDLDRNPLGRFIHLARDTDFGCEVRSRFWLFKASPRQAMSVMKYCLEVMGRLAEFLPDSDPSDEVVMPATI